MIFPESFLYCIDNSGAVWLKCIEIYKRSRRSGAIVGDVILVSVISCKPNKKIKKGQLYKALIVRTKKVNNRSCGMSLEFENNCVIILNQKYVPLGTRVKGPVSREIKKKSLLRVLSLCNKVI